MRNKCFWSYGKIYAFTCSFDTNAMCLTNFALMDSLTNSVSLGLYEMVIESFNNITPLNTSLLCCAFRLNVDND